MHTNYLLQRGNSYFISKLYIQHIDQLPSFLSGFFVIWFNVQLYKKVRALIFILLSVLTRTPILISKTEINFFFYTKVGLDFFFSLITLYLSNVDILVDRLSLNKGFNNLEVFIFYNRFPVIPELDSFFEQLGVSSILAGEKAFGLKLFLQTITLFGAETFLRFFKLPLLFNKHS